MIPLRKVLAFSAGVEAATGLALIAAPEFVMRILIASDLPGVGPVAARFFGVALIALVLAVWPRDAVVSRQPVRAMLFYNVVLAVYLIWLAVGAHLAGPLLWPAVIFHVAVAALLLRPERAPA